MNWNDSIPLSEKTYSLPSCMWSNMIQFFLLLIFLVIVNFISLAIFGIDKLNSKKEGWRVPESRLLLIAFF